jgi:hypothetical protein
MAADPKEGAEVLEVVAYAVELPSGKYSRLRVGADDAQRYVDQWNADRPKPPLAKRTSLTDHAAATSLIAELQQELAEVKRDAELLDFMQLFADGAHGVGTKEVTFTVKTYMPIRDQLHADRKKLEAAMSRSVGDGEKKNG